MNMWLARMAAKYPFLKKGATIFLPRLKSEDTFSSAYRFNAEREH